MAQKTSYRRNRQMLSVDRIFEGKFFARRGRPLVAMWRLRKSWAEIVGEDLAQSSTPLKLDQGKLIVGVESSILAHQLNYMKRQILEKLKQECATPIKALHFVQAVWTPEKHQSNFEWASATSAKAPRAFKQKAPDRKQRGIELATDDRSLHDVLIQTWNKLQAARTQNSE